MKVKFVGLVLAIIGLQLSAWAAGDANNGKIIAQGCVGCHGTDGVSKQPMHPNLAGQKENYLIWQLSAFRDGSRPSHIMNHVAEGLDDQAIADLSAYYSQLGACQ
ncbi:MAG: cytochrome c [Bdellovibrionaceae bacterium]|nr:cytochrome c [Bdellovibrionales bacterium]MCB9083895.1 cytochrome c [Pseudobdellovibrionaceae bacterium]